jgi:hypothetical protein
MRLRWTEERERNYRRNLMKARIIRTSLWLLGISWIAAASVLWAQSQPAPAERAQIQKSIQVLETVLNTVRQQALVTAYASSGDADHIAYFGPADSGRRCEGIYLENYGVLFEVYLPNFSEQRSINLIVNKSILGGVENGMTVAAPSATGLPPSKKTAAAPPSTGSITVRAEAQTADPSLQSLSKMIDAYNQELQRANRVAALQGFMEKLRASNIFSKVQWIDSPMLEYSAQSPGALPQPEVQRKQLQDALMRAVADYGSNIPHLQINQFITILMKAPLPRDFSLFSPETRTSTIIRFSVKDLEDYKTGKITYADLVARTKVQEN